MSSQLNNEWVFVDTFKSKPNKSNHLFQSIFLYLAAQKLIRNR